MARRLHAIDATSSPRPQRLDGVEAHEGLRNSSQDSRSHRLISTQARAEDDGVDRPAQRARRPADGPGVDVRAPGVRGRDVGPQQQGPGAATLARRAKGGLLGAAALAATCVEIKILRRVRPESPRRFPRHRTGVVYSGRTRRKILISTQVSTTRPVPGHRPFADPWAIASAIQGWALQGLPM